MTLSSEAGAKVRFPPPLVFLGAIVLGVIVQREAVPLSIVLARGLRVAAGVFILACGVSFIVLALILFKRTGQDPKPWKPTPEMVIEGPYRFTRNPMYVGMTFFVIGLGVAVNNIWISLFAAPALLVVHFIAVLPEERYLAEKFGETYRNFCSQVRRYL